MTEVPPEDLTETAQELDDASPEEYEPAAAVSPDTGTVYEGEGEPAATPHDAETDTATDTESGDAP